MTPKPLGAEQIVEAIFDAPHLGITLEQVKALALKEIRALCMKVERD